MAPPAIPLMTISSDTYGDDLAFIHDDGFGHLADHAGSFLVTELARTGARTELVVDLGCGGGILARRLSDAGYRVHGVDLSAPLIERARLRVPNGTFRVGSFITEEIPACVAVTAIGEVFSYAFDPANDEDRRARTWERIHAALAPGGMLLCDIAGPDRAPSGGSTRTFTEAAGWAVLMEASTNPDRTILTRRITTFRQVGDTYRRREETHRLHLVAPADVKTILERIGFSVELLTRYGSLELPDGLIGFLARKPT